MKFVENHYVIMGNNSRELEWNFPKEKVHQRKTEESWSKTARAGNWVDVFPNIIKLLMQTLKKAIKKLSGSQIGSFCKRADNYF